MPSGAEQEPLTLFEEVTAATGKGLGFIRSRWGKLRQRAAGPGPKARRNGRLGNKARSKNQKMRVLLIEAEWLSNLLLVDRLRRAGLEVEQAPNGCIALQKLQSDRPDAMLVSLPIGGITAAELIARARQSPEFLVNPIYLLSCSGLQAAGTPPATDLGASKLFDKLSVSAREMVSKLAAELGVTPDAESPELARERDAEFERLNNLHGALRENTVQVCRALQVIVDQASTPEEKSANWKPLRSNIALLASCAGIAERRATARLAAAIGQVLDGLNPEPHFATNRVWPAVAAAGQVLEKLSELETTTPANVPARLTAILLSNAREDLRAKAADRLRDAGFELTSFTGADAALEHLQKHPVELVVLDASTPNELAAKIQRAPNAARRTVVFVTNGEEGSESAKPAAETISISAVNELALKSLTLVHEQRFAPQPAGTAPAAANAKLQPEPKMTAVRIEPQPAGSKAPQAMAAPPAAQAPPPSAGKPTQSKTQAQDDRETLLARVVDNEMEVHRLRDRLARQSEMRLRVETELAQATQTRKELEKRLAEKPPEPAASVSVPNAEMQTQLEEAAALALEKCKRHEERIAELEKACQAAEEKARAAATAPAVNQAASTEVQEWERRVKSGVASLAKVTAELESERDQHRQAEERADRLTTQLKALHEQLGNQLEAERKTHERIHDLESRLRVSEESLAKVAAELKQEAADRRLAEEQLRSFGEARSQAEQAVSLFENARKEFQRSQQQLETRLQATLRELQETESKLRQETNERQRLADALSAAQNKSQQQSQQEVLEQSKLGSELQVEKFERNRLEVELTRLRQTSLDSVRANRAQSNRMRREVQHRIEELHQAACGLLRFELGNEPKDQVQTLLASVLSLKLTLQEAAEEEASSLNVNGAASAEGTPTA